MNTQPQVVPETVPIERPTNWALILAYVRFWAFEIFGKVVIVIVSLTGISEGLRVVNPSFGIRVFWGVDVAHLVGLIFIVGLWFLWVRLLSIWLEIEERPRRHTILITCVGLAFIVVDAMLFYQGIVGMTWGGSTFSWSALLCSASYVLMLVVSAYIHVSLKEAVQIERDKSREN